MTHSALSRSRRPMLVAAGMLVALTLAAAGPVRAAGPQAAPMGGPPGPGGLVEHVLATLKDKLALDTSQQVTFDSITAQTIAARDQAFAARADIRAKVDAELAKSEPDLAAIASIVDGAEAQGQVARRQLRDQWLGFYANLRADQKAIVRDAIRERLARMDGMREHMRERMQRRAS